MTGYRTRHIKPAMKFHSPTAALVPLKLASGETEVVGPHPKWLDPKWHYEAYFNGCISDEEHEFGPNTTGPGRATTEHKKP